MSRACVWLVVVAVICAVPMSTSAQIIVQPPEHPRRAKVVKVPSTEFPNIRSAIRAVPDGSTIKLAPGRYTESLTVSGKSVRLVGSGVAGRRLTEIVGEDPDAPVITFGPRGGGSVERLIIRDGAVGIKGVKGDDGNGRDVPPAPILLLRTHILSVGQGIFGNFSDLTVHHVLIRDIDWNGISILGSDTMKVLNSVILNAEAVGILVINNEGEGTIVLPRISSGIETGGFVRDLLLIMLPRSSCDPIAPWLASPSSATGGSASLRHVRKRLAA